MCRCRTEAARTSGLTVALTRQAPAGLSERRFAGSPLALAGPVILLLAAGGRLKPPGRCTKARYGLLRQQVKRFCKGKTRSSCNGTQSCKELNARLVRNLNCARAREQLNRACFGASDPGHRTAAALARIAAANCRRIIERKCE